MSVNPVCPHSLPCSEEVSHSGDISPTPAVNRQEESYSSLQMAFAEMPHTETASSLPSSVDLLTPDSPDSSTSPKLKLPGCSSEENREKIEEKKSPAKKQKIRTVFSRAQLSVLNYTFQRQKYLSLEQMQELSSVLNLSYKQVKNWFQNQRMKCKRWQKYSCSKRINSMTQKGSASTENPGLHSNCLPGYLVNTSGNLPVWSNQTWNNPMWSNQTWNDPTWSNQTWNNPMWSSQTWNNQPCNNHTCYIQSWNSQAWSTPFHNCGEESLQPYMQFQQNFSASDLEASLEIIGENSQGTG